MANEFDLYQLLVLDIFGVDNTTAFIFASLFVISFLAAKFRLPNIVFFVILILYTTVIAIFSPSVWAVTLLIVGAIFSHALGKLGGNR